MSTPLAVDLDGTLIHTDLLLETTFALLRQNPWYLFLLPLWLLRGKAVLKAEIARRIGFDAAALPYHQALLGFLAEAREQGRPLGLVSAADRRLVEAIAKHLQLFEGVLASDGTTNLWGDVKGAALSQRFGEGGFDYVGNSRHDLLVWALARKALVVGSESLRQQAARLVTVAAFFPVPAPGPRIYLRAIRLHQWLKNLLVFVPLLAAHRGLEPDLLVRAMIAFVAFGLCASSVYLLNDLTDLPADRRHPRKRHRPLAAGTLPIAHALGLMPGLLILAGLLALALSPLFLAVLTGYYLITLVYSFYLKRVVLLDVLTIASLYTLRIIAGAAAVAIAPTFWLLAFSIFVFLSLAMVKRYTELVSLRTLGQHSASGRDYQVSDLPLLAALGGCSGYQAVLVLALYINNDKVSELYPHPEILWLLCPLLLYWISRTWLIAHRGAMDDDPLVYALRDPLSRLVAVTTVLIMAVAALP